jgi:hypothetical protein
MTAGGLVKTRTLYLNILKIGNRLPQAMFTIFSLKISLILKEQQ